MYAVIFEVQPKTGLDQDYFDLAAELLPELEEIDGFISVERFQSVANSGRFVSISTWRDRQAVRRGAPRRHSSGHGSRASAHRCGASVHAAGDHVPG